MYVCIYVYIYIYIHTYVCIYMPYCIIVYDPRSDLRVKPPKPCGLDLCSAKPGLEKALFPI